MNVSPATSDTPSSMASVCPLPSQLPPPLLTLTARPIRPIQTDAHHVPVDTTSAPLGAYAWLLMPPAKPGTKAMDTAPPALQDSAWELMKRSASPFHHQQIHPPWTLRSA